MSLVSEHNRHEKRKCIHLKIAQTTDADADTDTDTDTDTDKDTDRQMDNHTHTHTHTHTHAIHAPDAFRWNVVYIWRHLHEEGFQIRNDFFFRLFIVSECICDEMECVRVC